MRPQSFLLLQGAVLALFLDLIDELAVLSPELLLQRIGQLDVAERELQFGRTAGRRNTPGRNR